jgi:hypothetical protein
LEEGKRGVEREKPEWFLVFKPNTVANKRTVMVHFKNAFVANRAVMTPRRLYFVTLKTVIKLVDFVNTLLGSHLGFPFCQVEHST